MQVVCRSAIATSFNSRGEIHCNEQRLRSKVWVLHQWNDADFEALMILHYQCFVSWFTNHYILSYLKCSYPTWYWSTIKNRSITRYTKMLSKKLLHSNKRLIVSKKLVPQQKCNTLHALFHFAANWLLWSTCKWMAVILAPPLHYNYAI